MSFVNKQIYPLYSFIISLESVAFLLCFCWHANGSQLKPRSALRVMSELSTAVPEACIRISD